MDVGGGDFSGATIDSTFTFSGGIFVGNVDHGAGIFDDTFIVHSFVGDTLDITGAIDGRGNASSTNAAGNSSFDFSGSSTMSLDGISSSDVCVNSASGTDYGVNGPGCAATPTPEPSSLTLLGSSLAGLTMLLAATSKHRS